jgi:hypothetical protein
VIQGGISPFRANHNSRDNYERQGHEGPTIQCNKANFGLPEPSPCGGSAKSVCRPQYEGSQISWRFTGHVHAPITNSSAAWWHCLTIMNHDMIREDQWLLRDQTGL